MTNESFILFTLGPVQGFIKAARTLRDLWSGSYLLSYLTFQAIESVVEIAGKDAIVFPALEQLPLWLWKQGRLPTNKKDSVLEPCIPNRFLAEVSNDKDPTGLAKVVEDACGAAWKAIAKDVRTFLEENTPGKNLDPYGLWDLQIEEFFEVYTAVLPQGKYTDKIIENLLGLPEPEKPQTVWSRQHQIAQKMLASDKNRRHFPLYAPTFTGDVPQKDTLLGTLEHLGPGNRQKANDFWESAALTWHSHGSKVTRQERLCAVSLVKRFAWAHHFSTNKVFNRDVRDLRYEDTATVAAAKWLWSGEQLLPDVVRQKHEDWSGQWLHWPTQDPPKDDVDEREVPEPVWKTIQRKKMQDAQGKPPTYYVVFVFDGDKMGDRFNAAKDNTIYRKISATLSNFALHVIKDIVEKYHAELLYAGGDDAICVLPTETALACVKEINDAFHTNWNNGIKPIMSELPEDLQKATISGGLVVAHYKEDLRFVLGEAHDAEKTSKAAGRNALTITVCRRSGEHNSATVPWEFVPTVQTWVEKFLPTNTKEPGASDRWVYKLRSDLAVLASNREMFSLELGRYLGRAEDRTKRLFSPDPAKLELAADSMRKDFDKFIRLYLADERQNERQKQGKPLATDKDAIDDFVTLLQTASFLARGRDA